MKAPQSGFRLVDDYAAAFFFADFGCDLAGVLGAGLFVVLAFSFTENSCLTLAAMASVSTL